MNGNNKLITSKPESIEGMSMISMSFSYAIFHSLLLGHTRYILITLC